MTKLEEKRVERLVLDARASRDFWMSQALLYQKELAIVNRACARKSFLIKRLRANIGWMKHDIELVHHKEKVANEDQEFPGILR